MFEAGIPPEASPELRDAGEQAFAVLRTATERLVATIPAQNRPPVLMMTLHIWAVSHGIASLFGRGDAARRPFPMSPEDLLEASDRRAFCLRIGGLAALDSWIKAP